MKMKIRQAGMLALVVVVWALSGSVGFAGEQQLRPHFVWNMEECIKPDQMEAYMKARVADAKLSAEHKFEFPFLTYINNFRVYTCGIFGAFSQLDAFPQMMEAWNEKTGGKSKQLEEQGQKCVSHCSTWIALHRPDLSYEPASPAFTPDFSKPFYQLAVVYYIKPGKYEEAQAVAKKVKELNEKRQSPMRYLMYERICGEGVPAFLALMSAADKAEFVNLDKKMQAKPDPEIEKIMTENAHLLTRIETMEGTFVPEVSYVPEGTF